VAIGEPNDEAAVTVLLDAGADDHVSASTGSLELSARLAAVLRRRDDERKPIQVGGVLIDRERHVVVTETGELDLTATEYRIVEALARRNEHVVHYEDVITHVWGDGGDKNAHTLSVMMCRIRRKLAASRSIKIDTIAGIGFRLRSTALLSIAGAGFIEAL
jgi:DNA-binding response OmpR family regulator